MTISADFPFQSKYIKVNGSLIHYVEEGEGDPILFIHGNPTSSYIWRNIIPHVKERGRCIALDLIGFGRSDKPGINYGFTDSYQYLLGFISQLGLKNITLVVQDWGSGLGFHYASQHQDNIKAIVFMEAMYKPIDFAALSLGDKLSMRMIQSKGMSWLLLGVFNQFVSYMLPAWTERKLTEKEMKTYMEPFKKLSHRKPVWVFPRDVPVNGKPAHTAKIVEDYHQWLKSSGIPKLCFYAEPGMLIKEDDVAWIKENFPNTTLVALGKGTHYVQEDYPHEIGTKMRNWLTRG